MNMPYLNLEEFKSGNVFESQSFAFTLGKAFEEFGFAFIRGHGVSQTLIQEFYLVATRFFSQPEKEKVKYLLEESHGQRGYTPFAREHARNNLYPDLKEFWQFGTWEPVPGHKKSYVPNPEVSEFPAFNEIARRLYHQYHACAKVIMEAIAVYLGLEPDYFKKWIDQGNSILRVNWFPVVDNPGKALREADHEDVNLITLMMPTANENGLQFFTREKKWLPVIPKAPYLIVNVGDMLERITNNQMVSATHRVVNPDDWNDSEPDISLPFFLHPLPEMPLICLDSCVNQEHPRLYEDISAGEFLDKRLQEIGLKV